MNFDSIIGSANLIVTGIDRISEFILEYAIALAAVGAVAMALLEAYKSLFHTRAKFHAKAMAKWFLGHSEKYSEHLEPPKAYQQLIYLTTATPQDDVKTFGRFYRGNSDTHSAQALFALEMETMMGQLQDAADTVLDYPNGFIELFNHLTKGADQNDTKKWIRNAGNDEPPKEEDEGDDRAEITACYTRLQQFIRKRLDAFQLSTSYKWRRWNQRVAIILGIGVLFLSLITATLRSLSKSGVIVFLLYIFVMFVISLIGGMAAPVAKDLVVALRKVRRGV